MQTNVYKLVLGVVITLISFSASAQDYEYIPIVKPGLQIWTHDRGYAGHDDEAYKFRRYALTEEDTIIENITYKKIYEFTDIEFNPLTAEYFGAMRETPQRQVFFRGDYHSINNEVLLYDFSLSVGDTFDMVSFTFVVESVDTINYNGIPRRKFTIRPFPYDLLGGDWIEGIGNPEGIYVRPSIAHTDAWSVTRCYIHNGNLLYSNYSHGGNDCITPLMGVESIIEDNSITLYPNPTSSEVNISSENIINSIEIFNSLGQRVYYSVVNSIEKVIDISSFTNGVYILGVNTENGVIRKKIIKN
ncbi:MAG: T9SS type A sorting domain-containing protein [Bacteroidales bacterium]